MQEPVSGNYLYRRAVQECGVWLMALCCTIRHSILNAHSLDPANVEQYGAYAGALVDNHASEMSSEQPFHSKRLYMPTHVLDMFYAHIQLAKRLERIDPYHISLMIAAYLLMLYDSILENDEFIHMGMASLPETIAWQQQYVVLSQPLLECFAKIDLLYVLRYQAPPTLGSTFEQSMQPLRPDVVQAMQDTRTDHLCTLSSASGTVSSIEDDDS